MTLDAGIEAVLFYKAEPVSIRTLRALFAASEEAVKSALAELSTRLKGRGVQLVLKEDDVLLVTSPEASEVIETISRDELERDLSKAAFETLTIILYRGPVTRSEIDYIRGVNSQFVLRSLLMRGLIEKVSVDGNERVTRYGPTFSLLGHLGIKSPEELPDFVSITKEIANTQVDPQDNAQP